MRLYRFRSIYMLVVGSVMITLLILGLSVFFINKFFITSYDPTAYILLFLLFSMLISYHVALLRVQAYQRCFYRFRMDSTGIECYDCFGVHIKMKWDEIRTYGVTGHDHLETHYTFIFFSKIANEPCDAGQMTTINRDRFVMEASTKSVNYLKSKLPEEFLKHIIPALERKPDVIHRR